ncbi:hypothetical protein RhiirA5_419063 [Rhizophagus irregularis]|uniref:Uncharacterized protein n=1 Tax=Rhizophagus irregularis TaxID=588596 RepID=A0A2I1F677_9GLOM|nr:hypothetical protein RhiirA5_419063 [Rhizophagus irregularis]PKC57242.1 hypothetical protein RhiirA1_472799 [Rhizophagus irregularis]PKY29878.1 hypothetical protein RhiirB3_446693 [Rhizophagus irregularis]
MKTLGFMYLKYILLLHDVIAPLSPLIQLSNTLTRLIGSRHQFPAQKHGHITYGKRFIERLTKAIWYIDLYLEKLRLRGCHLPLLFNFLPVYWQNGVYNEYYQRIKKKKPQLIRLKLFQLANSIELSLAEP